MCVHLCGHMCVCECTYMSLYVYAHVCTCLHACACICACVHMCVCVYMYGYVHACLEVFQNFQALQSLTHKLKRMSKVIQALGSPFLEFCG